MTRSSKKVKAAILEVVHNQLRDNRPPETRKTYQRLLQEGFSDQQARELIGAVVSSEIFEVLKKRQPYDQERFIAALERLPKMPWE
jgi:hypothetical protein